jgi:hypothetical protein
MEGDWDEKRRSVFTTAKATDCSKERLSLTRISNSSSLGAGTTAKESAP